MAPITSIAPPERIAQAIVLVRGERVMLDQDLALLYGVETRGITQAVNRNRERFSPDFMFRLTRAEYTDLRSQAVMSSGWDGRRHLPHAFTEHGVAMLSSVLRSPRAVRVNIEIMRAFVRLRRILASLADFARRLDDLELKYDGQFRVVFQAIRHLMAEAEQPRRRIGYRSVAE